jgi:uncharacterized protein DUF5658
MRGQRERRSGLDRRHYSNRSVLYGAVCGQRRAERRTEDSADTVDHHGWPLWLSSVTLIVLCAADALLTLLLVQHGAYEANPFMEALVGGDALHFVLLKLILTTLCLVLLLLYSRRRFLLRLRAAALIHLFAAGYVGLIGWELYLFEIVAVG